MICVRGTGAVLLLAFGCIVACTGRDRSGVTPDTSRTTQVAATPATAQTTTDTSTSETPAGRGTILFLGTSLTAGLGLDPDSAYPQQLQRKIDAAHLPYQTVNAGVSGETSAGLLRRLDWILQRPAQVIVVETGANDGLRGQP